MLRLAKIYLLPGAILQSLIIGGGYGTGRELIEFFTGKGMGNGLLGMSVATAVMSAVFALSLALAIRFQAYDYRTFLKLLLGRAWFLFEVLLVLISVLVFAVMGSAAGNIMEDVWGLPTLLGSVVMLISVMLLTFLGREWVIRVLASWSVVLYTVFLIYFLVVMVRMTPEDWAGKFHWQLTPDWMVGGLQYACYNVIGIPVILYAARAIETERQAIGAGVIGGVIAMTPAFLFHIAFTGYYPQILNEPLPTYAIFNSLSLPVLYGCYLLVMFGTFIETGAGTIQGIIERLDAWWKERRGHALSRGHHAAIAALALILASGFSTIGIVNLIATGYGTLAWGFLVVYLMPLVTVGVWRLSR